MVKPSNNTFLQRKVKNMDWKSTMEELKKMSQNWRAVFQIESSPGSQVQQMEIDSNQDSPL